MAFNSDASSWKRSNKIFLLLATVWPFIYMALFFGVVFTMIVLNSPSRISGHRDCEYLDALQLDRKIQNGEIQRLTLQGSTFVAISRLGDCYEVRVNNESSSSQILRDARELVDDKPRVDSVDVNTSTPATPGPFAALGFLGFFVLMILHLGTILLMMAQMPVYIVFAVKNNRLDQTKKIIWVVLFAVVSLFAAPVYWYLHIWRKVEPPTVVDGL